MLDILGYWVTLTLVTIPLPIMLVYLSCATFGKYYRENLSDMGITWYHARDMANDHVLVKWTRSSIAENEAVAASCLGLSVVQFSVGIVLFAVSLKEKVGYAEFVIGALSMFAKFCAPMVGTIFIASLPFMLIPLIAKIAAKVTYFSAKVKKLGDDK